ncbi:MAG: hypothetical protein WAO28_03780 [Candidatus Microsaccharimonas sp.]
MAVWTGWRITRTGIMFIIGIVVLAGLVFGAVLYVQQRGEQARRAEAVKIAEQNLTEQSKTATQPIKVDEGSSESSSSNGTYTATQPTTPVTSTGELPATGADASNIIVVTVLSLAVSLYIASRRMVREL